MSQCVHDTRSVSKFSPQKMNKVNLFESPRMFCDIYCLEPGQYQKEHTHDDSDKIYHGLMGTCRVRIGEESQPLEPGQIAVAPAGVVHGVHNDSAERVTLLVVMAPHPDFSG